MSALSVRTIRFYETNRAMMESCLPVAVQSFHGPPWGADRYGSNDNALMTKLSTSAGYMDGRDGASAAAGGRYIPHEQLLQDLDVNPTGYYNCGTGSESGTLRMMDPTIYRQSATQIGNVAICQSLGH